MCIYDVKLVYKLLLSVKNGMYIAYTILFFTGVNFILSFSFPRYIAICHPMKAIYMSSTSRAKKIILIIWILAAGLAMPAAFVAVSSLKTF